MITVYIASPYTKGDVAQNVRVQLDTADELMTMGFCPIVPLFTHFQHLHRPRPYEDWMRIDEEKVRRCDVLLRLPGESLGADREVCLAKSLNIPVVYSLTELRERKITEEAEIKKFKDSSMYRHIEETMDDNIIAKAEKYKNETIVEQINSRDKPWPGKRKNVNYYYRLSNGILVGHNESMTGGYSFEYKGKKLKLL